MIELNSDVGWCSTLEINASTPGRRSILLVYVSAFFFWAAIYLYVPVLPVYAESLGASLTTVGAIGAAYALPQLLFRIPIGMWSDSMGRRKPLVIFGVVMTLLGALGLRISPDAGYLALSRGLVGVGAATWVAFTIYAVSFYPPENTARAIGILNFIFSAALTATTVLGGVIADIWDEKSAFLAAAVLAVIALVLVLFARERRLPEKQGPAWTEFGRVARRPLLIVVSVMGILVFFAQFASVLGFVPVYAARIGASNSELGILTMLSSGGSMIGALLAAPLAKRRGNIFTVVLGAFMLCLSLLAVPFVHGIPLLDAVQTANGLGWGICGTQLMALSIYDTAPAQRATAMGVFQATYALGMLLGPLVSGLLADRFGLAVIFYFSSAICLLVIGLAFLPVLPGRRS
jgi:DHA1 family multidrug resistance protein-like MFS transporter